MLDCPRAYSADDQRTEGNSTDVVCYCTQFQLLVRCLFKNALSCSAERVVLLYCTVCTPVLYLIAVNLFLFLANSVVSPPNRPVRCGYALAVFQQHHAHEHSCSLLLH